MADIRACKREMLISMKIVEASAQDKPLIESLMQSYLREVSVFDGSSPNPDGKFDLGKYFSLYWSEPTRFPYLFLEKEAPVGFALVRQIEDTTYSVAEFYIKKEYRGRTLGRRFAQKLFSLHQGRWKVAELEKNVPAQKFWRAVIHELTDGNFSEKWSEESPRGPMQEFTNTTD